MIPLYVKSVYSYLNSIITIDDLISLAKENNWQSLSLCDDNMHGIMEFLRKCEINNLNPVVGVDYHDFLLYAKNYQGYQNLLLLEKKRNEHLITPNDLDGLTNDLICLIDSQSSFVDEMKHLFEDIYVYSSDKKNQDYPYLHKTLCLKKEDINIHSYLTLLKENKTLSDEIEFDKDICYQEENSFQEIFSKCHLKLPKYTLSLPNYCDYNDTSGLNSDEYLYNLSVAGLNKRLDNKITLKYKERLLYELDVIKKMGFSNYFLVVYDYIKYAKRKGILVGPGRGSAAGSLVSFSLGITDVDPLKYHLLFERFLNVSRITLPDIDTDFPYDRRDEVIDYCIETYGKEKVSGIITFNTFGSKLALRDMGRVLNIPSYIVDDMTKKIKNNSLHEALTDENITMILKSDNKIKNWYHVAMRIEGLPKNISSHASGVIISQEDLTKTVPLLETSGRYIAGYEANFLEDLGLLKMDFLGNKNLTLISNIISLIKKKEPNFKFSDIPLDDYDTFKIFQDGDTNGIFQFESNGMKDFLVKLHPENFMDIYNANAFFRPGPSNSIDSFIRRRHQKEAIDYYDSRLEPILKDTMGIIVYQEQIMLLANTMADFTLGEADILRRAVSKKKISDIEKLKDQFISKSIENHYDPKIVQEIFHIILNFASYGLNKSHSVAYSMISYKMAYLKYHYPLYFYLCLLEIIGNDEEKMVLYLKEMKKKNIKIIKPDINKSFSEYKISYEGILLPITIIKGISNVMAKKIIEIREEGFQDIYDFFCKMELINMNKSNLTTLIISGVLDSLGYNRNTLLQNMDNLMKYANLAKDLGKENVLLPEIVLHDELQKEELIENEKKSFGFYLSNHPTNYYKSKIKNVQNLSELAKYFNKNVTVVLMVEKIKEVKTKKGDLMAFIHGSDEDDETDIICFPKLYENLANIHKSDIIIVKGKVEKSRDFQIIANEIMNVREK